MKILSLTKSTGGLASYNENLMLRLVAVGGIEVEVGCLSEGRQAYAARLRRAGLCAHEIDMPRYAIRPLGDLRAAVAIVRLARRGGYDLVLGQGTKAGFLARLCGRLIGIPSVYNLASLSFEPHTQGARAGLYRGLERLGARLGSVIVTVCDSTREQVIARQIAPRERVYRIHTGIDPSAWAELPDRAAARAAFGLDPVAFTVGWAARMTEQKDPHRFLDALHLLRLKHPAVRGVMAGEGELRLSIARRVSAEELPVTILPWQEDVKRFLAAVDAFVLTSRWEGLSIALLEAMAAGLAVVATPVDGTPEVVRHGVDGLLASSPQEIAMCLDGLIKNREAVGMLGRAARLRIASAFNVDRMVDEWIDVLCEVAGVERAAAARPPCSIRA